MELLTPEDGCTRMTPIPADLSAEAGGWDGSSSERRQGHLVAHSGPGWAGFPMSCTCSWWWGHTLALPRTRPGSCPALPSLGPSSRHSNVKWGTHAFVPVPAPALTLRERQEQKENGASAQIYSVAGGSGSFLWPQHANEPNHHWPLQRMSPLPMCPIHSPVQVQSCWV